MKKLLAQLAKKYPHDRIAPGVMVSWLADKELYYVAVHRFKGGLASRKVLASANGPDLENTILAVRKMVFHERELNEIKMPRLSSLR
jgi:hypothetical protein